MRENRTYGSEGGEGEGSSLPLCNNKTHRRKRYPNLKSPY